MTAVTIARITGHVQTGIVGHVRRNTHEFDPLVIEAQLAHSVKDANGRAYNRTTYLSQRAKMMQAWADYLDELAAGAKVIPLCAA